MKARPAKKPKAPRRLLPARIRVRSASRPYALYTIVINPGGVITCNCQAGWHRRLCRHVAAVTS